MKKLIFALFLFLSSYSHAAVVTYPINVVKNISPSLLPTWNVTVPTNLGNITDGDFETTCSTGTAADWNYPSIVVALPRSYKSLKLIFKFGCSLIGTTNSLDCYYDDTSFLTVDTPSSYQIRTITTTADVNTKLQIKVWPYTGAEANLNVYEMQAITNMYFYRKM